MPKITWIKDGTSEGEGDTLSFGAVRSKTGRYWCLAENGLDTVNASAYLDVQCKCDNMVPSWKCINKINYS